ncbi:type II toxin-antitoxin system RelE/ParE family toxin [Patescibacteria group bacterium]|nr:type II toxin-antitoxin system RelE/ParE family toxin [Patescibacteria group bacterium]
MDRPYKVYYYISTSGENPFSDFLDQLSSQQQAKILRIFSNIKVYGLLSILPHIKKLSGTPLWEIRILGKDNIRILYVCPLKEMVIVLHGFVKKKQKTPAQEIGIALQRYKEWSSRVVKS